MIFVDYRDLEAEASRTKEFETMTDAEKFAERHAGKIKITFAEYIPEDENILSRDVTATLAEHAELRSCQNCWDKVIISDLRTTHDRYGIPYKIVCPDCYEDVQAEAREFEFDPLDAGERLEED